MQIDPQKVIQQLSNEVSRLTMELAIARAAIEQIQARTTTVASDVAYNEGDDDL